MLDVVQADVDPSNIVLTDFFATVYFARKTIVPPPYLPPHPNIVSTLDYSNGFHFFDYYECPSSYLQKSDMKAFSRKATIQITSALTFLHRNGIIHGDIRPQNIAVTKTFDFKLTTYFSKEQHGGGQLLPPFHYKPVGEEPFTFVSDVFSFGMTVAEWITVSLWEFF